MIRLLVDYNEHYRKGDEAPPKLAKKLVKAGLAEEIADKPVIPISRRFRGIRTK